MTDITQVMAVYGIGIYRAEWIDFPTNARNAFSYRVKFLKFVYDEEALTLTSVFLVERSILQNGVPVVDLKYNFNCIASDGTSVDKFGTPVLKVIPILDENDQPVLDGDLLPTYEANPDYWGSEFDRMSVFFNAPLKDNEIIDQYISDLFNAGLFDFPKVNTWN